MNYLSKNAAFERPDRSVMYDTEHPTIDAAVSEKTNRLNAARDARDEYDRVYERYIRLRSRLESGRAPRYGNPLGVRVDSSGGGSGTEDAMLTLVELGDRVDAARLKYAAAVADVRALIHKACRPQTRQAVALEARYLSFPTMSYADVAAKYPTYFRTKDAARWAETQGETAVAQLIYDEMKVSARNRVLPS